MASRSRCTAVYGPVRTNTLWSGFGGGCQSNDDGDATIAYDRLVNRWIVSQFSVSTTPYLQCVAVSTWWWRPRVGTMRGGGAEGACGREAVVCSQASQCGFWMKPAKGFGSRWRFGGALSQITENRKVQSRKSLIF